MRRSGAILAAAILSACPAFAAPTSGYHAPRTRWGAPDLQGEWSNGSLTHLERPPGVSSRAIPAPEADVLEGRLRHEMNTRDETVGQGETEWYEPAGLARVDGAVLTSWLKSPENGRLPYRPAAMKARAAAAKGVLDDPELLTPSDRCLSPGWSASGPPMLNPPAAPNYRILQTAEEVVIVAEMNHEVRHIRMNAAHDPPALRRWGGDSIGRWEGDTLVVETTNFHPGESYRAPVFYMSPSARVTERFTRRSPNEMRYAFSVEDAGSFTEVWAGEVPLRATTTPMFEYACHEGNYSMAGMLGGARRTEAEAAKAKVIAGR